MIPLVFAKPQGMAWNNNKITDHKRSEISVDTERIESSDRMANGNLRKYVIADKRSFSTSWDDLPDRVAGTVDGFWGGREMLAFYKANAGAFTLRLNYGDNSFENITVVFTEFSYEISKRASAWDLWQVSVEMEEV